MHSLDILHTLQQEREREVRELLRIRALLRDQATQTADQASRRMTTRRVPSARPAAETTR